MSPRKTAKKTPLKVYSTPTAVVVTGATASDVRKAMKLLAKGSRPAADDRTKAALKFYDISERFFKLGGRYKKPFTRKKKAK